MKYFASKPHKSQRSLGRLNIPEYISRRQAALTHDVLRLRAEELEDTNRFADIV